jgi:uncharacterized protein (TIGR02996 family)
VIERPDDDAPRRACADALDSLGDPRGRFIRVQLRVAGAEREGTPAALLREASHEADTLLNTHGAAWTAALCPPCTMALFVRGFVEHVALAARDFVVHGPRLLTLAPIRHLDLSGPAADAAALFASPALARVRSLQLDRCGLGDDEAALLAASPQLGQLEWLELMRNDIGFGGARALAASAGLQRLRYVGFFGNRIDPTEEVFIDQGIVIDRALPPEGELLEQEFGPVAWLRTTAQTSDDLPPRRY